MKSKTQNFLIQNVTNSIQKLINNHVKRYQFYVNIFNIFYEIQNGEILQDYLINLEKYIYNYRK